MPQKGLAIIYNSHNLLEFIWYYASGHSDVKWDALCLPSGPKGEYVSEYCKRSAIFENIISDNTVFANSTMKEQFKLFVDMLFSFLVGRRKKLCKKVLSKVYDIDEYDSIVVLNDYNLMTSLTLPFADEKQVVILEDGFIDYQKRQWRIILKNLLSLFEWKGFLLSLLGYSNTAYHYPLKTTSACEKYATYPDKLPYKNYKIINKVFESSLTNSTLHNQILKKTFGDLSAYSLEKIDTVIFTTPLSDYTLEEKALINKVERYISENCNSVLIKKHPRDNTIYNFIDTDVKELDSEIPAELLLPLIKGKRIIFLHTSTIIFYLNSEEYSVEVLYYNGLYEESMHQETFHNYVTKDEMKKELFSIGDMNCKIVEL